MPIEEPTWENSTDVPTWEESKDEAPTWDNSSSVKETPWRAPSLVPPLTDIQSAAPELQKAPAYISNVARAIPADVAAGLSVFKRPPEQQPTLLPSPTAIAGAVSKNLPAAAQASGNIPAALAGEQMPIDEILSAASKEDKTAATIGKISQGLAATAPMAAIGVLPSAAQKLALIGFTAKMMSDAPELATQLGNELGKPEDQRDPDKLTSLISDAIQVTGFATLGASHLINGGLKTISDYAKNLTPRGQGINFDIEAFNKANQPQEQNAISQQITAPPNGGVRARSEVGQLPEGNVEEANARLRVNEGEGAAPAQVPKANNPAAETAQSGVPLTPSEIAKETPPERPLAPPETPPASEEVAVTPDLRKPERGLPESATESDLMADMTESGRKAFAEAKSKPDEFTSVDVTDLPAADRRNLARLGLSLSTDRQNRINAVYPAKLRAEDLRKAVLAKQAAKPPTPAAPSQAEAKGRKGQETIKAINPYGLAPEGEKILTVTGKTIRLNAAPDVEFFAYKRGNYWTVIEKNTGSGIGGIAEKTRAQAIAKAEESIAKVGNERMKQLVSEATWLNKEKPTPSTPPISQGPGAASPGDVPQKSQIEQLGSAFKGGSTQKQSVTDKVKEIFNLENQKQISKDLLERTLSALKTSGNYLIETWKGQNSLDPILKSKGILSSELEARGWRMRQAMKDMKRAVPDLRVREAISKYVDAGGDIAKLKEAAESVPANRRAPYDRAMALTPEERVFAGHVQSYFESRLQEAIDAGVLDAGIEDYIHRIYPKETDWKKGVVNAVQNGVLNTRTPGLAMKRVFALDSEAEKAGYKPVNDFIPRVLDYEASLAKVISSRAAVKRFTEITMPDGRKMLETSGLGIPIENPEGIREATLIRPSGRPSKLDLTGYQSRDYSALKKWKWAAKDSDGKPIFVEGNVLIHPDAVHRIDALLEPSKIRKYGLGRAALGVGSVFKQTMLDFSGFHQVQIAIHGLEHKVNPFNLVKEINFEDPNVTGLLRGGVTLGGEHAMGMAQEGLIGRSLSRQIPGIGPLMRTYHEWLFQDFIPRVKMTMAVHALERNRARFKDALASGKMTEDALFHQTAKEANAAFGGLNYIMLERSKTAQDLARLTLLAPDFLEARGRFVGQSATRLGGEQRMALFLGALTLYAVARVMNKTLDDQWHFEPENAFSVVYKGKAYSIRTVQGDVLHALEEPVRFWLHRLNPAITRPVFELMTGRDEFGRKRTPWQVLGDSISNVVPISMRSGREQGLFTSLLNSFGGSVRRYSEVRHVYEKAQEWKKANGVREEPGEFVYDPDKDVYRPLKLAIMDGGDGAAAVEYQKLLKNGVTSKQASEHFKRYASSPFTGSKIRESKFKNSLSDDEKKAYEGAVQERQRILHGFYQAVQQQHP